MANERTPEQIQDLWKNQEVETMQLSLDELRRRTNAFYRRIHRRNIREYAGCALAIGIFGFFFAVVPRAVPRVAFALIVAGAIYVAVQLYRRGSARSAPAEMGYSTCVGFLRRELERQRDLLESIWSWYLGPFIPGMALLLGWGLAAGPNRWFPAVYGCFAIAGFWGIAKMNQTAARHLQRQIEELSELEKES